MTETTTTTPARCPHCIGGTVEDWNADPDACPIWPPDVPCQRCGGTGLEEAGR